VFVTEHHLTLLRHNSNAGFAVMETATYWLATREHLEQLVNILQGGGLIEGNGDLQHQNSKLMLNAHTKSVVLE
jgi:hypothetical protein